MHFFLTFLLWVKGWNFKIESISNFHFKWMLLHQIGDELNRLKIQHKHIHKMIIDIILSYKIWLTYFTVRKNSEKSVIWWDNVLFASKAKIKVFWIFFKGAVPPKGPAEWRKNVKKTLILAFEVIVQPPKHIWNWNFCSRFSSLC